MGFHIASVPQPPPEEDAQTVEAEAGGRPSSSDASGAGPASTSAGVTAAAAATGALRATLRAMLQERPMWTWQLLREKLQPSAEAAAAVASTAAELEAAAGAAEEAAEAAGEGVAAGAATKAAKARKAGPKPMTSALMMQQLLASHTYRFKTGALPLLPLARTLAWACRADPKWGPYYAGSAPVAMPLPVGILPCRRLPQPVHQEGVRPPYPPREPQAPGAGLQAAGRNVGARPRSQWAVRGPRNQNWRARRSPCTAISP